MNLILQKNVSFIYVHLHDGAFQNALPLTQPFLFILTNLDSFSKVFFGGLGLHTDK